MTWNYRVLKTREDDEDLYEIIEAYYDHNNKPDGYCPARQSW